MTRGEPEEGAEVQYTLHCKHAIQLAALEAFAPPHPAIGTEHLVLGLLNERDGWGGRVLVQLGVDLEKARREVVAMLEGQAVSGTAGGGRS
jgi:ATP-dependent Clp protease ATP-binding subunit ClpC